MKYTIFPEESSICKYCKKQIIRGESFAYFKDHTMAHIKCMPVGDSEIKLCWIDELEEINEQSKL